MSVPPQMFAIQLQPDDIIIVGTDGLFDNVFPEESVRSSRSVSTRFCMTRQVHVVGAS